MRIEIKWFIALTVGFLLLAYWLGETYAKAPTSSLDDSAGVEWYWPEGYTFKGDVGPEVGMSEPILSAAPYEREGFVRVLSGSDELWFDYITKPVEVGDIVRGFVVAYAYGSGGEIGGCFLYAPEENAYLSHTFPVDEGFYRDVVIVGEWFRLIAKE